MDPSIRPHHHQGPSKEEERGGGILRGSRGTGQSRASKKRAKKKHHKPFGAELRRDDEDAGVPSSSAASRGGADANEKKATKQHPGMKPSSREKNNSRDGSPRMTGRKESSSGGNGAATEKSALPRRKRPRQAGPHDRDAAIEDQDDGDEDVHVHDHDEDAGADFVDDGEFFDAEAGKKVQFQVGRESGPPDDGLVDKDADDVPVASSSAAPSKGGASHGPRATMPPPSVTRITHLLCLPVDDHDTGGATTKDNAESEGAPAANEAATTSPNSWASRLTTEQRANALLTFLLRPSSVTTDEFYATYWEKKPLLVQAVSTTSEAMKEHRSRFSGLMGLSTMQDATQKKSQRQHPMYYSRDLNVTKCENVDGTYRRRTLDPAHPNASSASGDGAGAHDPDRHFVRVDHDQLWDELYHKLGCTIRLLCPHKHFPNIHAVLSLLEHEFGNMVGANAYLTPPSGAQGFAPHYDDIEAFVCQLEGQKRWKVYAPLTKAERLPRTSSRDYVPSDLRDVEPVLDVVLSPGDLLYMPRGWIHQACTLPASARSPPNGHGHSLHLTISTMQQWAWVDLMENLMSDAVESLAGSDRTILLREGLPRNFVSYMGVMHDGSDESMPESLKKRPYEAQEEDADELARLSQLQASREAFRHEAKRRIAHVAQEAMNLLDASCDQMAKRFLSDRLPPAGMTTRDADLRLQPDALCRLTRPGVARLVIEDGKAVLYHCADNSLVFHENPLSPLEFELDDAPALEQLLTTVEPRWISVQDLYHDTVEDKMAVAQSLYDEGILEVRWVGR